MGCFCHVSVTSLEQRLAASVGLSAGLDLQASASAALSVSAELPHLPGMSLVAALAAWLAARGLPATPWQPETAWLELKLPMPQMDMQAVAMISALVELRTQVLAQFGLDLLVPAQVQAMARIVTTMNAQLGASALAKLNLTALIQLAARNDALDQVQAALRASVLTPPANWTTAVTRPGGIPLGQWAALLAPLRRLAPLIAASLQLKVSITDTTQLAAALRLLAQVRLPALAVPDLTNGLTVGLSAIARLQASLAIDPLQDLAGAIERVQVKLRVVLSALAALFGPTLATDQAMALLLAKLPALPIMPGSLASADAVRLAVQAQALAAANWKVPLSLPAVPTGLATCALAAQMQAALRIQAVMPSPCGAGCNAAALMRAVSAA
jgi:hypothetical protein